MKKFNPITKMSIAKCKSVGINADQLDVLVSEFNLDHNLVADLLHRASNVVIENVTIPSAQLNIVAKAIKHYQSSINEGDSNNDCELMYEHFDCYSLGQLLSGDYKVNVELTDNNFQFGLKSGVDIPEFVDDDEPTGSCPTCRREIYDHSEYCEDTCKASDI